MFKILISLYNEDYEIKNENSKFYHLLRFTIFDWNFNLKQWIFFQFFINIKSSMDKNFYY